MLTTTDRRPWLVTCRRATGLRLIGFPYAGGGPSLFRTWPEELLQDIELCAVHLPGRESRMNEPPVGDLRRVVAEVVEAIEPVCDRPVALFGHSIGGLLAFECARELRRRFGINLVHLFVSGCPAPQLRDQDRLSDLPDAEFLERMRRFNGTPREIFNHSEMMELMLPTLRADFSLRETYHHEEEPPLTCPISAFGGMADEAVRTEQLEQWRSHTAEGFQLWLFQGDHFFIRTAQSVVVEAVTSILQPYRQMLR
ncbi:MAG: thioesterase [Nitrospira sp.]|nr:thioesterase [Nitrospira sp.]